MNADPLGYHGGTPHSSIDAKPTASQTANVAPGNPVPSEISAASGMRKALKLVESIAASKNRQQMVLDLVRCVSAQFPNSGVRCGFGAAHLKQFYDSRLGWLGRESSLFVDAQQSWSDETTPVPTRPAIPKSLHRDSKEQALPTIRINIDDELGLGRCVLWIEGGELWSSDQAWLRRAVPSLRAIMWHRPGDIVSQVLRSLSEGGLTTRICLGLACLVVILLTIWPVPYRVRCTSVVRPKFSRVIAAPFNATLQSTRVTPGDTVRRGDVLLSLDGHPLRLELETVEAQIGQVDKERDIAMVADRVAETQQAKLRIRELTRQRDLIASRLQRLDLTSPIDGMVVSGDLSRSIGAPLEMGQAVMEIAPLEKMVIELEIPEYEIGHIHRGSDVRVRLRANNGDVIEKKVERVLPTAEVRDGQNVFIAQIAVMNTQGMLRPGMRGDAIAYGPIRPWMWSLTRSGWEKTLWWIGY